jgi:hypothetical protein
MTNWTEPKSVDAAIEAFAEGYAFTHGRLHSDGRTLLSYGLAIARRTATVKVLNENLAVKPNGQRSQTTVRHIRKVLRECPGAKVVDAL